MYKEICYLNINATLLENAPISCNAVTKNVYRVTQFCALLQLQLHSFGIGSLKYFFPKNTSHTYCSQVYRPISWLNQSVQQYPVVWRCYRIIEWLSLKKAFKITKSNLNSNMLLSRSTNLALNHDPEHRIQEVFKHIQRCWLKHLHGEAIPKDHREGLSNLLVTGNVGRVW